MYLSVALVFVVFNLMFVAGCQKAAQPTPSVTETGREQPVGTTELVDASYWRFADYDRLAAEGKAIFNRVGCVECHGADGMGTERAPALAGKNRQQVISQIRNPLAKMPAFPPSKLSRQEAELVALYIESLGTVTGSHEHPTYEPSTDPVDQLSMAVIALVHGNDTDAMHHVGHAIVFSKPSPELNKKLGEILLDIGNGQFLRAQYRMQTLILEMSPEEGKTSSKELHFRLALDSLESGNTTAALHLEHLLSLTNVENQAQVQRIIELLEAGNLSEAHQGLKQLLP
jgi:cytochrome c553